MEPTTKRIVQLDSGDEKEEILARRGVFFLQHEIEDCSSYMFCNEAIGSKLNGCFKERSMTVVLNTPGGNIQHGLAIYDTIRMLVASGTDVHVVGLGLVASMGTVIMQAASRRIATPYTQFLVHQLSMTIDYYKSEEVTEVEERANEAKRLNDIVMGIIADHTGVGLEELKSRCTKKNLWMGAEAALKFGSKGLIDEVAELPACIARAFKDVP
ncbi:MAG TPA: ATP-dependent Clp protease proteolytic subunit [Candidatus Paceibacterota bacterium]|nr:ATP-dependent Clp protease proteolytic subunit [Candidatus Paceibacterota bacterium]